MAGNEATPNHGGQRVPEQVASSYYVVLGVMPSASNQQIRRAYRELSKLYHPDTTALPPAIATAKFQQLNEAYATLSSPEQRAAYDLKSGYSRLSVIRPPADLNRPTSDRKSRSSAYLEPIERPLSPGEVFALFILGLTFVACLILVVAVGLTRGELAFRPVTTETRSAVEIETVFHQDPTFSEEPSPTSPPAIEDEAAPPLDDDLAPPESLVE